MNKLCMGLLAVVGLVSLGCDSAPPPAPSNTTPPAAATMPGDAPAATPGDAPAAPAAPAETPK